MTGWLWGGGAGPNDGTNTNVGWISANNTNQGSAFTYGLNIPSSDGPITGSNNYVWSENIGWVSFNEGDLSGCPTGTCNARRDGDYLRGWARILSIRDAGGNSGGWDGWISLDDKLGNLYAVQISKMLGVGSGSHTYAWSASASGAAELGWIDFGQAKYAEPCTLEFVPATKTINENSSDTVTLQEVSLGSNCNSGIVTLTKNNPIVSSLSPISVDFSAPEKETRTITLGVGAVSADTTFNNAVTATSATSGSANLSLLIKNIPVCSLNCPSEIILSPGQTKSVKSEITITGETGCTSSIISCSESGSDSIGNIDVSSGCDVSETRDLRYGSSELTATGGSGAGNFCTAPIYVRGPGWIETNP